MATFYVLVRGENLPKNSSSLFKLLCSVHLSTPAKRGKAVGCVLGGRGLGAKRGGKAGWKTHPGVHEAQQPGATALPCKSFHKAMGGLDDGALFKWFSDAYVRKC